jgi:polysaccharide chain length determinant protein (PEP-CTERM system associated)
MIEEIEGSNSESVNLRQYLPLVRRRLWHFVVPLFLGWLTVWSVSWVLPSVYRSGTLILVAEPTMPKDYVVPNVSGNLQERLQSITQQILSRTRLLHIIDELNLYTEPGRHLTPDDAVERMRKDIEIELVHERDELTAFNVYYSSHDPHVAQKVTSELTNLFISENLEMRQRQSQDTTNFLESQLEGARKTLAEQEAKIREFKDQHPGELPTQLQSNLAILTGVQSQLQNEEDALNASKHQEAYLQSLMNQYHSLKRSAKTGAGAPIALPALDQELDRLRGQLADLSSHYTEQHPDVRKLKQQIAKTQKLRDEALASLKSSASATPADASPDAAATRDEADLQDMGPMLQIQGQLQSNQVEIANREHSIEGLKAQLNVYQGRLNQEPVREQQLTDLTRGYEQSKANYDELLKKKNGSEMATSMELRQQGEHFRILDPPSLPVKPSSPNRLKLCGIGLVVGVLLGAAVSAGAEVIDDRLFSEKELKEMVPVVVLSEIPNLATAEEKQREFRWIVLGWVAAGFAFAVILAGSALSYFRG